MSATTGFGRDPYPKASKFDGGPERPINTPEWRDVCDIRDDLGTKFEGTKYEAYKKDPPIIHAVRVWDENPKLFDEALARGDDINTQDRYGYTPLMLAIKSAGAFCPMSLKPERDEWYKKQDKLISMILDCSGLLLDIQTKRGFSALMVAAWKGNLEVCQKLITMGATIYLKETGGRNAWGIAHDWHKEEVLELLGQHGLNFKSMGGTATAFPPAPKWRQDEKW
jgi:hypothetical protein